MVKLPTAAGFFIWGDQLRAQKAAHACAQQIGYGYSYGIEM